MELRSYNQLDIPFARLASTEHYLFTYVQYFLKYGMILDESIKAIIIKNKISFKKN